MNTPKDSAQLVREFEPALLADLSADEVADRVRELFFGLEFEAWTRRKERTSDD